MTEEDNESTVDAPSAGPGQRGVLWTVRGAWHDALHFLMFLYPSLTRISASIFIS
jgi:hypothetical protein